MTYLIQGLRTGSLKWGPHWRDLLELVGKIKAQLMGVQATVVAEEEREHHRLFWFVACCEVSHYFSEASQVPQTNCEHVLLLLDEVLREL